MIDIDRLEREIIPETRAASTFFLAMMAADETLPWDAKQRDGRAWYLVGQQGFFLHVPGKKTAELIDAALSCAPRMCEMINLQADTLELLIKTIREQKEIIDDRDLQIASQAATIREMHAHARDRPDCHRL